MVSSVKKQLLVGGGAVLLTCALCVHIFLPAQAPVELGQEGIQDDISSLVNTITGSIGSKDADKHLGPVASLSTRDYSPSQIKKAARMIRLAEKREQVGYLRKGDSLPGMPIQFYEGTDKDGHYTVRSQCEEECLRQDECKAYTYLTETGKCYLKSAVKPGLSTKYACGPNDSCWYFGVITNRH